MELQRNQLNKSTISDEAIIALYWNRDENVIFATVHHTIGIYRFSEATALKRNTDHPR